MDNTQEEKTPEIRDPRLKYLKNYPHYYIDTFARNFYVYRYTQGSRSITLYGGDKEDLEEVVKILQAQAKAHFQERKAKRLALQHAALINTTLPE